MRVTLAVALPGHQEVVELELPAEATLGDAIAAADLARRFPGVDLRLMRTGIWSREARATARLREGDRVELYRQLSADPKDMRRRRARASSSSRSRSGP